MTPKARETRWVCDQCRRTLTTPDAGGGPQLPPPWREFWLSGWVGTFVACSAEHEREIRRRYGGEEE